MNISVFIFARGGSKGVKNKNIKMIYGKPLIAHSIDLAKKIPNVDKIYVSTDSSKISSVAANNGAELIKRPKNLCQDDSPEWQAWQHAIEYVRKKNDFDIFLSLPATSPLRNLNDVTKCISSLDSETDAVVGITKASQSPWFNMVKMKENGSINVLLKTEKKINNRQESPMIYDLTTVAYVSRPHFIMNSSSLFDGRVKGVEIPPERSIDIDTELDFEIAQFLLSKASNE